MVSGPLQTVEDRRVAVIGLGYVGLTLAVTLADVGFDVLGIEKRDDVVAGLRHGIPQFHERGLKEQLRRVIDVGQLTALTQLPDPCPASVFVITVGTPLDDQGRMRLDMITLAARQVAAVLPAGALVILRSTVSIGTTRTLVKPILDEAGVPYSIAFCPERTLEGKALEELRHLPQIIGADDANTALRCARLFQSITPTTVRVSSIEAAEMVKLVDNSSRDVYFAYANEIACMCDAIGIGAQEVLNAARIAYPRAYLAIPGPVGGPCLSKDPHIMVQSLAGYGAVPTLVLAARCLNEGLPDFGVNGLATAWSSRPDGAAPRTITLMGLAFKGIPETDDLRGTTAIAIIEAVRRRWPAAELRGWDRLVPPDAIAALGLTAMASRADAMAGADIVVLCNNHPSLTEEALIADAALMARPGLIYDFWGSFVGWQITWPTGVGYMAIGSHGRAQLPWEPAE